MGENGAGKSTDQTAALLQNYPDLKVICAPTTVGIAAAAKYLQDNESACKLTRMISPQKPYHSFRASAVPYLERTPLKISCQIYPSTIPPIRFGIKQSKRLLSHHKLCRLKQSDRKSVV